MRYVAVLPDSGRTGHQFVDLLTAFAVERRYPNFCRLATSFRDGGAWGEDGLFREVDFSVWTDYFNLGDGRRRLAELEGALPTFRVAHPRQRLGVTLAWLDEFVPRLPDESLLVFTNTSTLDPDFLPAHLAAAVYGDVRRLWRRSTAASAIATDWDGLDADVVTVAVAARTSGRFADEAGRLFLSGDYCRRVCEALQEHYGRVRAVVYSAGPRERFRDESWAAYDVRICDEQYPRLFEVHKSCASADFFVSGATLFSTAIHAVRTKPTLRPNGFWPHFQNSLLTDWQGQIRGPLPSLEELRSLDRAAEVVDSSEPAT